MKKAFILLFSLLVLMGCPKQEPEDFSISGDLSRLAENSNASGENLSSVETTAEVLFSQRSGEYYPDANLEGFPERSLTLLSGEAIAFSPLAYRNYLCIFEASRVRFFDLEKEEWDWSYDFDYTLTVPPRISKEGLLVLVTGREQLHLMDIRGGTVETRDLPEAVYLSPAISDFGVLYLVGSRVTGIDSDGETVFELTDIPDSVISVNIEGNQLYLLSGEGVLKAYSASEGRLLWEANVAGIPVGELVFRHEKIYLPTTDDRLICLNAGTGKMAWIYQADTPIVQPAAASGDILYLVSEASYIHAVDAYDGHLIHRVKIPGEIVTPPVVTEQGVFLSSGNSCRIYRYDLREVLTHHYWGRKLRTPLVFIPGGLVALFRGEDSREPAVVYYSDRISEEAVSISANGESSCEIPSLAGLAEDCLFRIEVDQKPQDYLMNGFGLEFYYFAEEEASMRFEARVDDGTSLRISAMNLEGHTLAVNSEHLEVYPYVEVACDAGKIYRFFLSPPTEAVGRTVTVRMTPVLPEGVF